MNFIEHPACQAVIDTFWRGGRNHSEKRTADGSLIPTETGVWMLGYHLDPVIFWNKLQSPMYGSRCLFLLRLYGSRCLFEAVRVSVFVFVEAVRVSVFVFVEAVRASVFV
jgi:hypothetical protein